MFAARKFPLIEMLHTASLCHVQFCLCPGVRKNISILRVFHKWPMNYRRSFILKTSDLACRDPLLSSQTTIPRTIIAVTCRSIHERPQTPLSRHGLEKTSSFSLTATAMLVTSVSPRTHRESAALS